MTEEKQIEEILMEASSYSLRAEVIELALEWQNIDKSLSRLNAYHLAFNKLTKQVEIL